MIREFMIKISGMEFYVIEDLYSKKEKVRRDFEQLGKDEKYIYKWFYFYQTCHLNSKIRENMWDYITGVISDDKIEKEYKIYCQKKEEISKKAKERQALSNI